MFNSRHFDTLVRHVRFVKKKLCHIYDSSKSQKVHLRLACEQCVNKGKIDFFSFPKEQAESPDHFAVGFVKKDPLVISQSQISYPPPPQKSTGQIE